jgi:carbon monoxide dehydrogenase subunit G
VQIRETLKFDKTVEEVWEFIQDVPRVAACMPGLTSVRQVGSNEYTAEFKVGVGPVKAAFAGKAMIVERVPGERIVAKIEGKDPGTATTVKADFTGELSPSEDGTQMEVLMEVAIRGRLAQFGSAVILATSKKLTAAFAQRMRQAMSA